MSELPKGYEEVNIELTLDEFKSRIQNESICVDFHIKYTNENYQDMPHYDEMRENLKDNESWDELQELDGMGILPTLYYKHDNELIDEIIENVRVGHLSLDKTQIRYKKENRSEFYSGVGNNIKMVLKWNVK